MSYEQFEGSAPPGAMPVPRGCGPSRIQGACYAECGLSPLGRPIEEFLLDPPVPVPPELPVAAIGVQLIERGGAYYVMDRVGGEFYPNVADFVEEVRHFGLSRRLPKTLDFSRLGKYSRILLVHDRAWIENCPDYGEWGCPRAIPEHAPHELQGCCAGVWWRDIIEGEPLGDEANPRLVLRRMPSFAYRAQARPEGVMPLYAPAFFLSLPITRIAVVAGEGAAEAQEKASRAGVPVVEVAE